MNGTRNGNGTGNEKEKKMKTFTINCGWCLKSLATTTCEKQAKVERFHIECLKVAQVQWAAEDLAIIAAERANEIALEYGPRGEYEVDDRERELWAMEDMDRERSAR